MDFTVLDLSKDRIVLIGGCGFIGHHLALALKQTGCEVLVIDNLGHNNLTGLWAGEKNLEIPKRNLYLDFLNERLYLLQESGCRFANVDSRNEQDLRRVVAEFSPTKVVHMAAVSNVNVSNKMPYLAFDNNMVTLKNTLEVCRELLNPIEQLVFFSSSMVYGDFPPEGVSEDVPPKPKGIYGALKLGGEHLVAAYGHVFGIPYTVVRPSALYGPRCVSRRVTQVFVERAIEGKPLIIEGDGMEKLDFTYVDDLVQGVVLILAKQEALNQVFNLTLGQCRRVNDLVAILKTYFPNLEVQRAQRNQEMPLRGTLDITKARELLQYEPEYHLERGYAAYIEWYREKMAALEKVGLRA